MLTVKITRAQRTAAAGLPFKLTDAEIVRQFNADGTSISVETRNPMAAARNLARQAMNDQIIKLAA